MLSDPFFYTVLFVGLCLGSFATALSYRIPRDISIVKKQRSSCPSCHHDLSVVDLIPFFSWAFLGGKCRFCKARIGIRYPLIELATTALCVAFYAKFGFSAQLICLLALAPVLVSIADIDLHYKIIPDGLNLSIALVGFAAIVAGAVDSAQGPDFILTQGARALGGVLVWGLGSWILRWVFMTAMKREPMGLGDVKFFAAAGVFLGIDPMAAALFMIVSGGSGVVLALLWKKITGDVEFPFGPSLLAAFIPVLFIYPPSFMIF